MPHLSRRHLITGALGTAGVLALAACGRTGRTSAAPSATGPTPGRTTATTRLVARRSVIDLGGPTVHTWTYGDTLPGPVLRARAGDRLRVRVDNRLPVETSVHWHGIALRNAMDGVPGLTQDAIAAGGTFDYDFTVPDPGTYFYHPHVGVQLDRGLYAPLIVDDPHEPGRYDHEWIVVLDDWVDGTGRTPDDVLAALTKPSPTPGPTMSGMAGMAGMDMSGDMSGMDMSGSMSGDMSGMDMGESSTSPVLGGAGDVVYPHYLVNGKVPASPETFTAKPRQKVRIRIINAGSDTAFRVALGGHRLTVTHSDGFPVRPTTTDALIVGMGERFDVEVTLGDGVFPLVAVAEGKTGQGLALLRTGGGAAPGASVHPTELDGRITLGTDLAAAGAVRLKNRPVDRTHTLALGGTMTPYRWTLNGKTFPDTAPLPVVEGQRVRLRYTNRTMMFHPMHLHGHTFALAQGGARKDTVIVRPMQTVEVDFDADNPGKWVTHCHNIYHAETGMTAVLAYA